MIKLLVKDHAVFDASHPNAKLLRNDIQGITSDLQEKKIKQFFIGICLESNPEQVVEALKFDFDYDEAALNVLLPNATNVRLTTKSGFAEGLNEVLKRVRIVSYFLRALPTGIKSFVMIQKQKKPKALPVNFAYHNEYDFDRLRTLPLARFPFDGFNTVMTVELCSKYFDVSEDDIREDVERSLGVEDEPDSDSDNSTHSNMAPKTDVKSKKNQKRKLEASDDDRPRKSRKTSSSDSDNNDVNQMINRHRKYKPVEEETIIEDLAVKPKKKRKKEVEISLNVEKPKKKLNKESRYSSVDDSEDEPSRAAVELKKNHSKKSEASKEDIPSNDKKSKKNGHKKSDQSGEKVNHKKSEFSEDEDVSDESTEQKKKSKRKSSPFQDDDDSFESFEDVASKTSDTNESSGNGKSPTNAKAKNDDHTKLAVQRKSPNKTSAILFIDFIKDLKLYGTDRLKKYKGKPDIAKIAASIPELQQYRELYTKPSFNTDFNALYTLSARRKHITVDLVVGATERFLNDGSSVESFDNFPKSPSTAINAYIASHRDGKSRDYTKLRHKFSSGDVDTRPYYDKYAEECQTYMEELKQYIKEYSDYLLDSHKAHINSIISKTFKTVNAKDFGTIKKKNNNNQKQKQKKTAFDWFKDANPELCVKYDDDETRDQKLRKKFEKLAEKERKIYENIAAKNS